MDECRLRQMVYSILFLIFISFCCPVPSYGTDKDTLKRAEELKTAGKLREAIRNFQEVLKTDPKNRVARMGLARTLAWDKQYEEAIAIYTSMLSESPEDIEVRLGLARVLAWKGDYIRSMEILERLLREHPESGEARWLLAKVMEWTGRIDKAIVLLLDNSGSKMNRMERLKELVRLYHIKGNYWKAREYYQELKSLGHTTALGPEIRKDLKIHTIETDLSYSYLTVGFSDWQSASMGYTIKPYNRASFFLNSEMHRRFEDLGSMTYIGIYYDPLSFLNIMTRISAGLMADYLPEYSGDVIMTFKVKRGISAIMGGNLRKYNKGFVKIAQIGPEVYFTPHIFSSVQYLYSMDFDGIDSHAVLIKTYISKDLRYIVSTGAALGSEHFAIKDKDDKIYTIRSIDFLSVYTWTKIWLNINYGLKFNVEYTYRDKSYSKFTMGCGAFYSF